MSIRLSIGDVVLVQIKPNDKVIGLIKYIGPMVKNMMSEYVGVELLKPIENGHNGTISDFTYFTTQNGYGFHCKLINIIRKLAPSELFTQLRDLFTLFHLKTQYIQKLEAIINKKKPEIPSRIKTSLTEVCDEKYTMPKRYSLSSKLSMASIMETNNETEQITRIHAHNRVRQSTSVTETSSLSRSSTHGKLSDLTDHELSLSSTYSSSNQKSQQVNHKRNTKKSKHKRKTNSSCSSTMDLSYEPCSYVGYEVKHNGWSEQNNSKPSHCDIALRQSETQIFGGNISVSYNKKPLKSFMYIKYINNNNLPSLSELSKSPKSPSSSPSRIGFGYFHKKPK